MKISMISRDGVPLGTVLWLYVATGAKSDDDDDDDDEMLMMTICRALFILDRKKLSLRSAHLSQSRQNQHHPHPSPLRSLADG